MARYFQHIQIDDELFGKVTELELIDNLDPTSLMFYFKDGSKCAKDYIAQQGDESSIGEKVMIEVTSPANKWSLEVIDVKETVKYGVNANGEKVELVDTYMYDSGKKPGPRVKIIKRPNVLPEFKTDDTPYLLDFSTMPTEKLEEPIEDKTETFDFNDTKQPVKTYAQPVIVEQPRLTEYNIDTDPSIEITYVLNGKKTTTSLKRLLENANKPAEVKVVEKEVVIEKPSTIEHIEIGLDDAQRALIDNMIDMSQKDVCDIDMEITLSLPPLSVYKLIKTVYPAGMAKGFVNIIADRMQIKELKTAVADGLLSYYDEDLEIEVSNEQPVIVAEETAVKKTRSKKSL